MTYHTHSIRILCMRLRPSDGGWSYALVDTHTHEPVWEGWTLGPKHEAYELARDEMIRRGAL